MAVEDEEGPAPKKDNQYRDCFNFYFILKNNNG